MPEYATITVQVTEHGDDLVGVDSVLSAQPLTTNNLLAYPGELDRMSVGTQYAQANADGSVVIQIPLDTFPINPPWRFNLQVKGGSQPRNIPLGVFEITASGALTDLVELDVTAVPDGIVDSLAGVLAEVQEARDAAVAVGTTNDAVIAGRINAPGSATADALKVGFVSKPTAPLNARDFGAIGNGIADDTAALQAWLDEGVATRRALYLPRGRYKTTSTLTIAMTDSTQWVGGVRIYGDGMGTARGGSYAASVIEPTNAVTGPALRVRGVSTTTNSNAGQVNGLVIQDLAIRGVEGGTNGDGIELKYWTNAVLRNLLILACTNGIRLLRQENGATFGYGNGTLVENCHLVINRGYGLHAADAGAMCGMTIQSSNFGTNALGGVKVAPGPSTFQGNIYTGNLGPGMHIVAPTGVSNATGPTVLGDHFETNGAAATANYSTDTAQVVIDYAQGPRFVGCNFLGSGNGEHSIKAGWVGAVTGLTMIGNTHFGKQSVTNQRVLIAGPNLLRTNLQDTEAYGFSGVSTRALTSQIIRGDGVAGYAALAQGSIVHGGLTAATGVASVVLSNADLPMGCRATFEITSQGGAVYAYGLVKRGRDGTSLSVVQLSASADCSLSIVSNSLRATQTNSSSLILWWSLHITQTAL